MRSKNLAGPILLGMILAGCSDFGGPRVYQGEAAWALLDTLASEQERVLASLKGRSYRATIIKDEHGLVSPYHSASHEETHCTVASGNAFSEGSHSQDRAPTGHRKGTWNSKSLLDKEYYYQCSSYPEEADFVWFCPRSKATWNPQLAMLPSRFVFAELGIGMESAAIDIRLEDMRTISNKEDEALEIEEIPAEAPALAPLYIVRWYSKRKSAPTNPFASETASKQYGAQSQWEERPFYEMTVDPNKDFWTVNARGYEGHDYSLRAEINISVSRNKTLEDQTWLADEYKVAEYGAGKVQFRTAVWQIHDLEFDIALPPDYFTVKRLNLAEGQEVKRFLAQNSASVLGQPEAYLYYYNGELIPWDQAQLGMESKKPEQSIGVVKHSTRLSEGMEFSEVRDLLKAEGREKGKLGKTNLWEWSDAYGSVEATFKDGKLINWSCHPVAPGTRNRESGAAASE